MPYATFAATDAYASKHSGSAIEALIINEDDPSDVVIGAVTSVNGTDDFETIPVEEAGEDGVNEIVQGRHTVNLSLAAFWTPEWNDRLPTRQSFIGKSYTVLERIGEDREGAGTVVNAYTGCVLSRIGSHHGARGAKTVDMAFAAERRYSGQEWATLTGT